MDKVMKLTLILASLAAVSLSLSACGGGDDTTPTGVPTVAGNVEPTVTGSGLQIYELEVGDGAEAQDGQTITMDYIGWLEDGTVFGSSQLDGGPFQFVLGASQAIPGWEEGVPGMRVGGKRRLVIPSELAYGEQGQGSNIPPNADLTFDIELIAVE